MTSIKNQLNNFAVNMWKKRKELGLNQKEFAYKCGVHFNTIQHIEQGKHSPSLRIALQIARKCKLSIEEMLQEPKA